MYIYLICWQIKLIPGWFCHHHLDLFLRNWILKNNLHTSSVCGFIISTLFEWYPFPALTSDPCMEFEASFGSLKKLKNVYLGYFVLCDNPHRSLLTSLPLPFKYPHPTAIHPSPNPTHILCVDVINGWPLILLTDILHC